jgi:hypothetical protein
VNANDETATEDTEEVRTALDSGGMLNAVVWAVHRGQLGHQYIVSFDEKGQYRSRVEVDPEEMATVDKLASSSRAISCCAGSGGGRTASWASASP